MAFDSTAGGTAANSYVSLQEADDYFEFRLHSDSWEDYANQEQALVTATKMLEWYVVWATFSKTITQALTYPDYASADIPIEVKNATCEMAYFILNEDRSMESDLIGLSSLKVGPLSITTDKADRKNPIPDVVWMILKPLGVYANTYAGVELNRG